MTSIAATSTFTTSTTVLPVIFNKDLTLVDNYATIEDRIANISRTVTILNTHTVLTPISNVLYNLAVDINTIATLTQIDRTTLLERLLSLNTNTEVSSAYLHVLQLFVDMTSEVTTQKDIGYLFDRLVELGFESVTEEEIKSLILINRDVFLNTNTETEVLVNKDIIEELDLFTSENLNVNIIHKHETSVALNTLHDLESSINKHLEVHIDLNKEDTTEYILNRLYELGIVLSEDHTVISSLEELIIVDILSECRMVRVSYDNRNNIVKFTDRTVYKSCT